MRLLTFLFLTLLFAADDKDPWQKVKDLKSGAEIRIVETGKKGPLEAKFDTLTEESLIVATKNEQKAIPRDSIERIDFRSPSGKGRVIQQTTTTAPPGAVDKPAAAQSPEERRRAVTHPNAQSGASTSTSFESGKSPWETIYRKKQ